MTPWWDGRPLWAVKSRDAAFLAAAGLRWGAGGDRLERALAASPGPWLVRQGEWVVVIGAPRAPVHPERLVLTSDVARDTFFAERTVGGAVVRRVERAGDRRVDEGRRGQKREPDLSWLDAAGVEALALAWGLDLAALPRAHATRLEPLPGAWASARTVGILVAVAVAAVAAEAAFRSGRRPREPAVDERVVGGLGTRTPACAAMGCDACVACVRAGGDDTCDGLRAACDADPTCRAVRACAADCAVVLSPDGRALDPPCSARCATADVGAVALAEAWLRCPYAPSECPACADLSTLPEL
jgi:hypothetical protein